MNNFKLFLSILFLCLYIAWICSHVKLPHRAELASLSSKSKINVSENIHVDAVRPRAPSCDNLLQNLTRGVWRRDPTANESYFDALFSKIRRQMMKINRLWREDGKCGYENLPPTIAATEWPHVPSWCDPHGKKPCCSNTDDGVCSLPSNDTCECEGCLDLTKYMYAEISRWETEDARCKYTNYSSTEACDVIRESPYDKIYFVGDSLMRNMFMTLTILLTGDPVRGAWGKSMTEEQKQICVSDELYCWRTCRRIVTSLDQLFYHEKLCGGSKLNFTIDMLGYYDKSFGAKFLKHVNGLLGKNGTLIVLGVGLHYHLNASSTIGDLVHPAVEAIEDFYKGKNASASKRWPRIFFVLPLNPGILKAKVHLTTQSKAATTTYSVTMSEYCRQHEIPLFDFRQLSHHVHSFDGTHFGLGVNLMKNQILLNYITGEANGSHGHTFS